MGHALCNGERTIRQVGVEQQRTERKRREGKTGVLVPEAIEFRNRSGAVATDRAGLSLTAQ